MAKRKTHAEFVKEVFTLSSGTYEVQSKYSNSYTHIEILHTECGNTYVATPNSFLSGKRCPHCFGNKLKSHSQFIEEVRSLVEDEYTVIGNYVNTRTLIEMRHNKCGHAYLTKPSGFLNGYRCPKCFRKITKTTEQFAEEVRSLVGEEYVVLGEYVGTGVKIGMRHNVCGTEYTVRPAQFLQGGRCPSCNESRGEREIRDYLTLSGYEFRTQYRIPDCRDKLPLPFDFLVVVNGKDILIEYDGIQHFEPVSYGGNEVQALREFKDRQRKDAIKTKYCLKKGITLVRISYLEFDDISQILNRELVLTEQGIAS